MGHYIPKKITPRRSIADTLAEAEDEHYLDCPDADLVTRSAALLLDGILIFLLITALDRIARAGGGMLVGKYSLTRIEAIFQMTGFVIRAMVFYFIDIWALFRFGGSAGKLLLGLRVVDAKTGSNLSFWKALLREVFGKILLGALTGGIGWAMAAFRVDRLAIQDFVGGSLVKKVRQ